MKHTLTKAVFVMSAVAFAGCAVETGDDAMMEGGGANAADESGEIVRQESFRTTTGGNVKIILDEEGGITVSIVQPATSDSVIDEYQRDELDLVGLYLGLTEEGEVPTAILELNEQYNANLEKADAAAEAKDAEADAESEAAAEEAGPLSDEQAGASEDAAGLSLDYSPMTTQQFIDSRCQSGWGYRFCYPSSTGSWSYDSKVFSMRSYAYSFQGVFVHKVQHKKFLGSWKTTESNRVEPGYLSYVHRITSGLYGNMKVGVWEASGDGYHISVYGTK